MKLRLVRIFYWTAVTTCLVVVFCARFRFSADFLSFYSDDYFYVLKVAQNIVTHHLSTFDGSTPTNGYHPLWTVINVILLYIFHGKAFFYALAIVSIACGIATFQLIRTIAKLNGVNEPASLFTAFVGVWWSLKLVRGEMEVVIAIPLVLGMLVWIMMPAFSWTRDATVYGLLASLAVLARLDVVLLVALLLAFQLLAQIIHKEFEAKSWLRGAMRFVLGGILLPAYIAINWFIFRTITPVSSMAKHLKTGFRLHFESLLPITRSDLTLHGGLQGWFFILPLIIAVIGLGWLTVSSIRNRSFDQPVQFAVYAFPLVHLGLLAMLSDWALWMWYFYPLVFVLCFACVQCFQAKSRPNRPVLRLPLEAIGIVVVMLATIRTIARERKTTPDFNTVYTCGVELARFANLHPGRYAMGDRAGIVGYLSANPTIQLEGLMMDKKFIETLRRAPKLNSVLDEYNIDYYIASHPRLVDSCYEVVEPAQAGPESPKMRGSFCEKPVFTVERNGSFNAVFRVKPLTQAANTAIR